jgi:hypothetical protein
MIDQICALDTWQDGPCNSFSDFVFLVREAAPSV